MALPSWGEPSGAEMRPVAEMSDEEVLRLADLRLTPTQDRSLSRLLDRQQAGILSEQERSELVALMQVYQTNLLRKAEALAEAVRRGPGAAVTVSIAWAGIGGRRWPIPRPAPEGTPRCCSPEPRSGAAP